MQVTLLLHGSSYALSTRSFSICVILIEIELFLFIPWSNGLQIISAVSGGITDLSFDAVGYAWQIINCFLTAGYSVCLL